MRSFCLVVVMAALSFGLSNLKASEGFEELSSRAKAGATEEELNAFVQKSNVAYDLTVDEIFVLNDLGYSAKTIAAIIDHGKDIKAGKPPATEVALPNPPPDLILNKPFEAPPVTAVKLDQGAQAQANAPVPTLTTSTGETMQIEETVNSTAQVETVVVPPEGDESISMFYQQLSPYGTWVRLNGGWYWQPTACLTDPNWRPYCDRGHWAWTDNDWCWQSDYSWGWAPFHYGRWTHCDGYGWVWMPDTVWSPAWVSWRECDSHYGWAPLPWHSRFEIGVGFGGHHGGVSVGFGLGFNDYCFCPCDHFCDASLHINLVFGHSCEHIYNRTTIIQNNVTVINNRVVVNGPRFDRVQERVGTPIRQLHLADANIRAGDKLARANREDRRNGTIQMYRPALKQSTVTPAAYVSKRVETYHPATTNTEHVTQPVVQHENTTRTPNVINSNKEVPLNNAKSDVRHEPVTQTETPKVVSQPKTYDKTYEGSKQYEGSSSRQGGYGSSNYNGGGNSGNNNFGNGGGKDRNNR